MALERVGSRHPESCQGTVGSGPCHYRRVPGSMNCEIHGGASQVVVNKQKKLENYILENHFGQNAQRMLASPGLKTLTDELVLTRATLEGVARLIKVDQDILIYSDKISSLVRSVQTLVESTHKLQKDNKELLDRQTLYMIVDSILSVILKYVEDPAKLETLAEEVYDAVANGISTEVPSKP
jgi:hypothetical protein